MTRSRGDFGRTVDDRLDLGYFQNIVQILGPEVRDSQTGSLKGAILDQALENGPELPNLAILGDEWGMDEKQVRR